MNQWIGSVPAGHAALESLHLKRGSDQSFHSKVFIRDHISGLGVEHRGLPRQNEEFIVTDIRKLCRKRRVNRVEGPQKVKKGRMSFWFFSSTQNSKWAKYVHLNIEKIYVFFFFILLQET